MLTLRKMTAVAGVDRAPRPDSEPLSAIDVIALVVIGALPIALLPGFYYPTHLRVGLALAALPLGVWLLAKAAGRRDRAAVAALGFLLVALVSAAGAFSWRSAFFGAITKELSVLALVVAFSWWAIGRALSIEATRLLPLVLTLGGAVNLLVAVLEILLEPVGGLYQTFDGRPPALMSNPVFLASTFGGVWAYWLARGARSGQVAPMALAGMFALMLGLAGSRATALVLVATVGAALLARPHRRLRIVAAAAISVAGLLIGTGVLNLASEEQARRYTTPSSGLGVRLEMWRAGLRAWSDRPLLGWGPSPYREDINSRLSEQAVREYGRLQWPDPHNVVILLLVSVGLVGVLALAWFVREAVRGRIDMPLFAAAAAIALSWLLQPVTVMGWPVAFVLLGAAVRPTVASRAGSAPRDRKISTWLAAGGVLLTVLFVAWSLQFRAALFLDEPNDIETRAGIFIHDPDVAGRIARAHKNADVDGRELDAHLERAEELANYAVEQTGSPGYRQLLVEIRIHQSDLDGALTTAQEWAEAWPRDPIAHEQVRVLAGLLDRPGIEAAADQRVCQITLVCSDG